MDTRCLLVLLIVTAAVRGDDAAVSVNQKEPVGPPPTEAVTTTPTDLPTTTRVVETTVKNQTPSPGSKAMGGRNEQVVPNVQVAKRPIEPEDVGATNAKVDANNLAQHDAAAGNDDQEIVIVDLAPNGYDEDPHNAPPVKDDGYDEKDEHPRPKHHHTHHHQKRPKHHHHHRHHSPGLLKQFGFGALESYSSSSTTRTKESSYDTRDDSSEESDTTAYHQKSSDSSRDDSDTTAYHQKSSDSSRDDSDTTAYHQKSSDSTQEDSSDEHHRRDSERPSSSTRSSYNRRHPSSRYDKDYNRRRYRDDSYSEDSDRTRYRGRSSVGAYPLRREDSTYGSSDRYRKQREDSTYGSSDRYRDQRYHHYGSDSDTYARSRHRPRTHGSYPRHRTELQYNTGHRGPRHAQRPTSPKPKLVDQNDKQAPITAKNKIVLTENVKMAEIKAAPAKQRQRRSHAGNGRPSTSFAPYSMYGHNYNTGYPGNDPFYNFFAGPPPGFFPDHGYTRSRRNRGNRYHGGNNHYGYQGGRNHYGHNNNPNRHGYGRFPSQYPSNRDRNPYNGGGYGNGYGYDSFPRQFDIFNGDFEQFFYDLRARHGGKNSASHSTGSSSDDDGSYSYSYSINDGTQDGKADEHKGSSDNEGYAGDGSKSDSSYSYSISFGSGKNKHPGGHAYGTDGIAVQAGQGTQPPQGTGQELPKAGGTEADNSRSESHSTDRTTTMCDPRIAKCGSRHLVLDRGTDRLHSVGHSAHYDKNEIRRAP